MSTKNITLVRVFICLALLGVGATGYAAEGKPGLMTESYYRVKWGYFDEFMDLFKKNHYPILKELQKQGYIGSIIVDYPINHANEEYRWDVRVTMTIPDTAKLQREMAKVSQKIYPDQDQLKKDETYRFRLLLAHQDVMIRRDDLSKW